MGVSGFVTSEFCRNRGTERGEREGQEVREREREEGRKKERGRESEG